MRVREAFLLSPSSCFCEFPTQLVRSFTHTRALSLSHARAAFLETTSSAVPVVPREICCSFCCRQWERISRKLRDVCLMLSGSPQIYGSGLELNCKQPGSDWTINNSHRGRYKNAEGAGTPVVLRSSLCRWLMGRTTSNRWKQTWRGQRSNALLGAQAGLSPDLEYYNSRAITHYICSQRSCRSSWPVATSHVR